MEQSALIREIEKIYAAFTDHRNQRGEDNDDRCILDDALMYYRVLPWMRKKSMPLPLWSVMEPACRIYLERRQGFMPREDRERHQRRVYPDLKLLTVRELVRERARLIGMTAFHELLGSYKTYAHDILIYQEIPDGFVPDIVLAQSEVRSPNCKKFCTTHHGKDVRFMDTWAPSLA